LSTADFACSRSGKRRTIFGFEEFRLTFVFLLMAGGLHASHDAAVGTLPRTANLRVLDQEKKWQSAEYPTGRYKVQVQRIDF
jgi:hypothetical protein